LAVKRRATKKKKNQREARGFSKNCALAIKRQRAYIHDDHALPDARGKIWQS
jgi:hypothetical protein